MNVGILAHTLFVCFVLILAPNLWGQGIGGGGQTGGGQTGGGQTGGGQTGGGQTGGGQGQVAGPTAADSTVNLDPFLQSSVARGTSIGPSAQTVRGFSVFEADETGANRGAQARGAGGGLAGGLGGALGGLGQSTMNNRPIVRSPLRVSESLSREVQAVQLRSNGASYTPGLSPQLSGIQSRTNGTTAVLQGQAQSEDQRGLAERVMLLNPNVRQIQNQITVNPSPRLLQPVQPVPFN